MSEEENVSKKMIKTDEMGQVPFLLKGWVYGANGGGDCEEHQKRLTPFCVLSGLR